MNAVNRTCGPVAIVNGAPVTSAPEDLYIPPDALEVCLEAFEGPLDLLWYLIKKQNIDIRDIPIAAIAEQYLRYIELLGVLRLELAAEYLLMAAYLAEIKSRVLLPLPTTNEAEEPDPRAELVRRLQEYQRFRAAAVALDALPRCERDVAPAVVYVDTAGFPKHWPEVTVEHLLDAWQTVIQRAERGAHHQVRREWLSVRERMAELLERLPGATATRFHSLLRPTEQHQGVVVTLLAVLELAKDDLVEIVQDSPADEIWVRPRRREG